jgi:maltooligosyltrehalose trehalohydrolase
MTERSDVMPVIVHHLPVDPLRSHTLHAWIGTRSGDVRGTRRGDVIDFRLPELGDLRHLRFLFFSADARLRVAWEPDAFIRRIRRSAPAEIWTFEQSARILYREPTPPEATFHSGDLLTFHVITRSRFDGGKLCAWSPFAAGAPSAIFDQVSRNDPVSTFAVRLRPWMTSGFHFRLIGRDAAGEAVWEPDSSNRVWSPADGDALWLKSGQVSVRDQPLDFTAMPVEVLYPPAMTPPPELLLIDEIDAFQQAFPAVSSARFPGARLFRVAHYSIPIYPGAAYVISAARGSTAPARRPFPVDPDDLGATSRFALDADGWLPTFPAATRATVAIDCASPSSFPAGLNVEIGIENGGPHQTVEAVRRPGGTWEAEVTALSNVKQWITLSTERRKEIRPYQPAPYDDWIDIRRPFTPPAEPTRHSTREGVYGVTARRPVAVAEPASRDAIMRAAFGDSIVERGVFGAREMPHGATTVGTDVYFVLHAPHAAWAGLVLVDEYPTGRLHRRLVPMSVTGDELYWWCRVPASEAPPGTRYRFALNDDEEVMDPAAREILDAGDFETHPGNDPNDPNTSWSLVLDAPAVRTAAHASPWQTMGWEALLIYEMHANRFTDLEPGMLAPLDVVADELGPFCRRGGPGYLHDLPVTALELMPVHEFKSTASWGYNPAFLFAIDGSYGGSAALARLVDAAHRSGKAVLLNLVYDHMNDSPLTRIAADVYRNGDSRGDRINHDHPMVKEFFRQAIVHTWRTFGLDGFRFHDTPTILNNRGWDFLFTMRQAVRAAADAEGRRWPFCAAENDQDGRSWNLSNPAWSILDGQWAYDESYRIREVTYDCWDPSSDSVDGLARGMEEPPSTRGRPYFEATRYAESHDRVSEQDPGDRRVAARPPFGQGLRMAKAVGTVVLLGRGIPMLFMGQEVGETRPFSWDDDGPAVNPQDHDRLDPWADDRGRVLAWYRSLMGLRNDPSKGLRGEDSVQVVKTSRRTLAFTCGAGQALFAVVTFGTPDPRQDSSRLGLPGGSAFKEIFNSSWPVFRVESEPEHTNGGYDARISSGHILNLPYVGAVVLERR